MSADLAPYFIVAWLVAMLGVFPSLPPHRGMLVIVLSGALFLPEAVRGIIELGPIKLGKLPAVSYAALLAAVLYDSGRLFAGSPRWIDLPMLVWCVCPLASVLVNDPPPDGSSAARDALAQTLAQATVWGPPYLIGRVYFRDGPALRDLLIGVVVGAAVYAPLCLWESRMSPQLHAKVYGFMQHDFGQTIRFDGYRPMVFMQHGLAVGMFMVVGAVLAVWARRPFALPGYLLLLVPFAVIIRSTGAIALGVAGGAALWLSRTGHRLPLLALAAVPPAYVAARTTGAWSGADLVEFVNANIGADRAQSLEFRLSNEDILIRKALERPLFGWGGWGRNRARNTEGNDITVTDGLWVIVLGDRGLVGLTTLGAALLWPVVRFARRSDPAEWRGPAMAAAAGCAVVVTLWCVDCLFNAMLSPLYPLMAGALAGFVPPAPGGPPGHVYHDGPGQEPGVPGVPPGQPPGLPGDPVHPLQAGPLDPPRGPPDAAGREVQRRPELDRHRHPQGRQVAVNPDLPLRLPEQHEQEVRPGRPDAAD